MTLLVHVYCVSEEGRIMAYRNSLSTSRYISEPCAIVGHQCIGTSVAKIHCLFSYLAPSHIGWPILPVLITQIRTSPSNPAVCVQTVLCRRSHMCRFTVHSLHHMFASIVKSHTCYHNCRIILDREPAQSDSKFDNVHSQFSTEQATNHFYHIVCHHGG